MDKLKKIVYIVSGTLSIMLMVFLLMHKVGLCASSGSDTVYVPDKESELPFPIYNASPLTDSQIEDCIATAYASNWAQYLGSDYMVCVVDDNGTGYQVRVFCPEYIKLNYSWTDFFSGSGYISIYVDAGVQMYVNKSTGVIYDVSYRSADISLSYANCGSASPSGGNKILIPGTIYTHYPIASNVEQWFIDSTSSYGSGALVFEVPQSYDSDFPADDYGFPDYSSLDNGITDPSDPDYNLYSWLNGQNKSNYDYTKSIFDLLKGFITWLTAPPDLEAWESAWGNTQLGGIVNYVSGLGDTLKSMLGVGVVAPETLSFNCSITLLEHEFPFTVDFGWYQSIKTQFLTVFLTFFYIGAFLAFIKALPSFINGVSGTMNNFTQAGGGSDD